MSYLNQHKSTCGRYPTHPKSSNAEASDDDEDLPMQNQIDNLRAKISLKQRYNKALLEEVTESHKGAHQMIDDLRTENESLRHDKNDAIASGTTAAIKALRNHRLFLLALRGKSPEKVLNWLDDQISDQRKKFDEKFYMVKEIKYKLSNAEQMVAELEQWPFPGSSPWEQEFVQEFTRLGVAISRREALKECVLLLDTKYKEIQTELRGEKDTWAYSVQTLEKLYWELKQEFDDLQSMLEDAIRLKKTTYYRLMMAEKEYAENRKIRHHRIIKIRKMCELEFRRNLKKVNKALLTEKKSMTTRENSKMLSVVGLRNSISSPLRQKFKEKKAKAAEYEDKAKVLVEAMRVKDLRFCPQRIQTVYYLSQVLHGEMEQKQLELDIIAKQKSNLLLIKNHLFYTGCAQLEEFEKACQEKANKMLATGSEIDENITKTQRIGDTAVAAHSALIGLYELLHEGRRNSNSLPDDYLKFAQLVFSKIKMLVATVTHLRNKFDPNVEPQRNYGVFVKTPIARNSCRLGAHYVAESDEDSSDDDDTGIPSGTGSDRVLDREELKAKSDKLYAQGMLRKGFQESSHKK